MRILGESKDCVLRPKSESNENCPFLEAEYNRHALLIVQTGQQLNAAIRAL